MADAIYRIEWFLKEGEDERRKGKVVLPHRRHAELRKILNLPEDALFEGCFDLTPESLREICQLFDVEVEYNDIYVYFIGEFA